MDNISYDTIKKCTLGNRLYQKEMYEKLYSSCMGICLRYTKSSQEAKDIWHDSFIKILNNIHAYKFNGSFEGWAKKIVVNTAIDKYREEKKYRTIRYEDRIMDNISSSANIINDGELSTYEKVQSSKILKLVQELSPGYRAVFNLYIIEGFTHREISEKLGISIGSSKSNLFKAKKVMYNKLKQYVI